MENNYPLKENALEIDSYELLIRFLLKCKIDSEKDEPRAKFISSCADIVTAIYYYRRYPDVNDFINKYLKSKKNYFHLQWARNTWATLSKLTDTEVTEIVINQISIIDNSDE